MNLIFMVNLIFKNQAAEGPNAKDHDPYKKRVYGMLLGARILPVEEQKSETTFLFEGWGSTDRLFSWCG